jgi:hypothetical protein
VRTNRFPFRLSQVWPLAGWQLQGVPQKEAKSPADLSEGPSWPLNGNRLLTR